MAVVISSIKAQLQADIQSANEASRAETNVDAAMNVYNDKMSEAIANAFETFLNTATVVGTVTTPQGPGTINPDAKLE